jgi:peptide/nickel transport system permease protein
MAAAAMIMRLTVVRLLMLPPIVFVVTLAMFVLGAASPFDPASRYLGDAAVSATAEDLERIRHNIGADRSVLLQWVDWWRAALTGDLGMSLSLRQPVIEVISHRLGWTLLLAGTAFTIAIVLSVLVGTWAALRPSSWLDRAVRAGAYVLEAVPVFWLALLLIWLFALTLRWLPAGGADNVRSTTMTAGSVAAHLVLPAVALAASQAPWFILYVRESVSTAAQSDYVTAARSRGLRPRVVVTRHVLRGALLPVVTLIGSRLPELITGAVLVETTFSWPGIAEATTVSAQSADFSLLAALTVLATIMVLLGNLVADALYMVVDPRVRING